MLGDGGGDEGEWVGGIIGEFRGIMYGNGGEDVVEWKGRCMGMEVGDVGEWRVSQSAST